jgi:hypothetical protein
VQRCSRGTIAWRLHEGRRRLLEAISPVERAPRLRALSEHLTRLLDDAGVPLGVIVEA